jgi:hypothetical protein
VSPSTEAIVLFADAAFFGVGMFGLLLWMTCGEWWAMRRWKRKAWPRRVS